MHQLTIEGYADQLSYVAGETVSLCCSTDARRFSVEVARVGGTREIVWSDNDRRRCTAPDTGASFRTWL